MVQQELSFPALGEDELEVTIHGARELRNPNVVSDPAGLATFVSVFLEYAVDMEGNYKNTAALHTHSSKQKGSQPSFGNQVLSIHFPCSRSMQALLKDRSAVKRLMRSKLVCVVWHKRFLLGALEVGRADVKLKEMSMKSELKIALKLKDQAANGGLGVRTGELDVTLRLRKPFEGVDLRQVPLSLIVVDEFEAAPPQQIVADVSAALAVDVTSHPSSASASTNAAAAASASAAVAPPPSQSAPPPVTATPAATPSVVVVVGGVDLSDPHDIIKMLRLSSLSFSPTVSSSASILSLCCNTLQK